MKIGDKKIKLINIPAWKEKFRERFRHEFKGYMSKSPLVWLSDVLIGAGCMYLHAPATSFLNLMAIGTAMTLGGAIGGIPLAFAGGFAGGWLAKRYTKTENSIHRGAIIGSFVLGGIGIAGGNLAAYHLTKERLLDHGHKKEQFNAPAAKPTADAKAYMVSADSIKPPRI